MDVVHSLKTIVKKKKAETAIVSCVFTVVFGCFTVPIIIYANNTDVDPILNLGIVIDIDNCPQQLQQFYRYNGSCSQYEGVCSVHLKHLAKTNGTLTTISNNALMEDEIMQLFYVLQGFVGVVNEKCSAAIIPLLCQYAYPPCDGNGSPLLITQEQCVSIRDDVCASEWSFAMATELRSLLPVCEALNSDSNSSSVELMNVSEPLRCHYQFQEYCGVCLPFCGKFSQYSDQVKFRQRGVIFFSTFMGLSGGILVLIAAIIRRKKMLDFPRVLAVCTIIDGLIIGLLIIVIFIGGQERLYCSHTTLHLSILQPSVFTQVAGFTYQFCLLFMAATWFLHVFHLFLKLAFPFWSSQVLSEENRKLKLCVLEILGATIFAMTGPAIVLSVSEYRLGRFPPLFPLPSNELSLYTLILPLTIILAVGVNLIFYCFWTIYKVHGLFKRDKGYWSIRFSVPQVKILLLLGYFTIFGIISLIAISVSVKNADSLIHDVFRYFTCNLLGYSLECEDIRKSLKHT